MGGGGGGSLIGGGYNWQAEPTIFRHTFRNVRNYMSSNCTLPHLQ